MPLKSLWENSKGDPVSVEGSYTETLGLKSNVSVALILPIEGISFVYLSLS